MDTYTKKIFPPAFILASLLIAAVIYLIPQSANADINNPNALPPDNSITNAMLQNGIIKDANVYGTAGIQLSKIGTSLDAGKVLYGGATSIATSSFFEYDSAAGNLTVDKVTLANGQLCYGVQCYELPASDGSSSQILTTNGAGILSWSTTQAKNNRIDVYLNQSVSQGDAVLVNKDSIVRTSQFDNYSTSNATTYTNSLTPSVSNSTVVCGIGSFGAGAITSATANGTAMTQAVTTSSTNTDIYVYYFVATSTNPINLTFDLTTAGNKALYDCGMYAGTLTTDFFDASSTGSGAGNASASATATAGYDMAFGIGGGFNTLNNSVSSGYDQFGTGNRMGAVGDTANVHNASTTGSQSFTISNTNSGTADAAIALFKSASTTGARLTLAKNEDTADGFIGFANAAGTINTLGNIIVAGDSDVMTGLTAGVRYYLSDTAGAVSTTAGTVSRKVGIAASSTDMIISNIW